MRVGVKICGVSTERATAACVDADVDWVGFVFFERSPRHVTAERAARLISTLSSSILPVGLFVSPSDAEIERVLEKAPLAALQVYDRPERITALVSRFALPVWHAVPVTRRAELPLRTDGRRLVVEARTPSSGRPGGNGTRLDWHMLSGWTAPTAWLLAGGLTPENVGDALVASGACAVDVSTGVEDDTGRKDAGAIRAFTMVARQAGSARQ